MKRFQEGVVRVPLTVAQSTRLARLAAEANAANARRNEVLSALVEGVTDADLSTYRIEISDKEIVLTAPMAAEPRRRINTSNGNETSAPADVMSP